MFLLSCVPTLTWINPRLSKVTVHFIWSPVATFEDVDFDERESKCLTLHRMQTFEPESNQIDDGCVKRCVHHQRV